MPAKYLKTVGPGKKIVIYDSDTGPKEYVVKFVSELLSTFILVFMGCLSMASLGVLVHDSYRAHMQVAFSFGFGILVGVQCFAHLSGSHMNPAVSMAACIMGHLPITSFPLYFAAQLVGGWIAHCLVLTLMPAGFADMVRKSQTGPYKAGPCTPTMQQGIEPWQGCLLEFVLTMLLILVYGAVMDWRNKDRMDSVSMRFGLAIAGFAMAGGAISGANLNPARTLGPCINNNDWENHWIYWVGPMTASIVGGLLYRFLFHVPEKGDIDNTV